MPLPLAHGLVGAAVMAAASKSQPRHAWKLMLAGAAVAVVPDFDLFLTVILHWGNTWHRGVTHSLAWAAAVGCVAAVARKADRARTGLCLGAAACSHGVLDWLVSVKGGVALLWPLSASRYAAGLYEYPDVLDVSYAARGDVLVLKGLRGVLAVSAYEVVAAAALLAAAVLVRRYLAGRSMKSRPV